MAGVSSGIIEDFPPDQSSLQQGAISEMSSMPIGTKLEDFVTIDMPPENVNLFGSTSEGSVGSCSNSESSSKGLPPKPKSEFESGSLNIEEAAILALGGLQNLPSETERSSLLRSSSLTMQVEILRREISMPASHIQLSKSNSTNDSYIALNLNGVEEQQQQAIYRSRSVPVSNGDGTIRENQVRVLRVVPYRRTPKRDSPSIHNGEEHQDDITEEEAVCRICFEELGEELESFKLECNCRGDLSLVHRECSQKWFDLRGNRTCEICMTEVQNITVKVTRRPTVDPISARNLQVHQPPPVQQPSLVQQPPPMTESDKLWHQFPFLVVANIVGYFMSVKLFQMGRGNDDQIHDIYDIPSSCVLGLVASIAASSFAQRKHMWFYALAQFIIFTVSAQIFYNLLRLQTIPTILFASALAMGISRGVHPIYGIIKKLRAAWRNRLNNNPQDGAPPTEAPPLQETAESHHSDADHHVWNE